MSHFDQRGQKVGKQVNVDGSQYNAGGNIVNVGGDVQPGAVIAGRDVYVGNQNAAVVEELQGILRQIQEAMRSGEFDPETAEDARHALNKAAIEAGKEKPDKSKCLGYLETARTVLDKVVATAKSAATIGKGIGLLIAKVKGWL